MQETMIKKSFPIKEPYFYDTKKGVDHFTKILLEEGQKKLSEKEKQQIHNLGKDMKRAALDHHIRTVQPFDSFNKETYPSRPEVRGKLMEIEKLEKDLVPKIANQKIFENNINRPVKRRNYFDDTVKLNVGNKGPLKLPELTPEEIERAKQPSDWDVIYGSMTPFEKGQWNAEQRKNKLQKDKEAAEDRASAELTPVKMAKEVIEHVIPSSSAVPEKKSNNYYPGALSAEDSISNMTVDHAIRPKNQESGLSQNFTRDKLAEGRLLKKVLDE